MDKLMQWKLMLGLGLAGFTTAIIAAGDKEGFIGVCLALIGASFWTTGVRLYLSERS